MNQRSKIRNKERNKYAKLYNTVMHGSNGVDPLGIPNVNFSILGNYTDSAEDIETLAKYREERIKNGFDSTECWNLDNTIAGFVLPRLKLFKEHANGYPSSFKTMDEWYEVIDKMIYAFDRIYNEDKYFEERNERLGIDWTDNSPEMAEQKNKCIELERDDYAKIEAGLELFAKHFQSLWW